MYCFDPSVEGSANHGKLKNVTETVSGFCHWLPGSFTSSFGVAARGRSSKYNRQWPLARSHLWERVGFLETALCSGRYGRAAGLGRHAHSPPSAPSMRPPCRPRLRQDQARGLVLSAACWQACLGHTARGQRGRGGGLSRASEPV